MNLDSSHSEPPAETSATHERMMLRALAQARLASQMDEVPVGAVIYKDEQVLAEAHNLRESESDPTAHAEIIALRQAAKKLGTWRLEGCAMAVTLEPCPMCAGALINARIEQLVYGATDPKMGCVGSLYDLCTDQRFNHRLQVTAGLMADPSAKLLQEFFRRKR